MLVKNDAHRHNLEELFHPTLSGPQRTQVIKLYVHTLRTIEDRLCSLWQTLHHTTDKLLPVQASQRQVVSFACSGASSSWPRSFVMRHLPAACPMASWTTRKCRPNAVCRKISRMRMYSRSKMIIVSKEMPRPSQIRRGHSLATVGLAHRNPRKSMPFAPYVAEKNEASLGVRPLSREEPTSRACLAVSTGAGTTTRSSNPRKRNQAQKMRVS